MKKTIILCMVSLVVFACSQKTAGTIAKTERTESATVSNEQYLAGKAIFTSKCGKCHKLKEPSRGNMKQWAKWLDKMAPKAKLTAEEKTQVADYISVNAKAN